MQKIMFEHRRFGLEQAVIAGTKTMTRRRIHFPGINDADVESEEMGIDDNGRVYYAFYTRNEDMVVYPKYQIGEQVAVAQSYRTVYENYCDDDENPIYDAYKKTHVSKTNDAGFFNKLFVRADLMPHVIEITDIKAERLQDISVEDCKKEGIIPITWRQWHKQDIDDFSPQRYTDHHLWTLPLFREGIEDPWADEEPEQFMAESANVAFAVLIMKLHGKKAWQRNEWQFAYTFKLIK